MSTGTKYSFEKMSKRRYCRMLPQNVREATNETLDFGLEDDVYICDICNVFLLNRETAFNHKTCIQISPSESKNVTVPKKPIVSLQRKLKKIDNNKTDGAAKNYGDFPSTSNQSYTLVCTNSQCTEVFDDSHCASNDTTSVTELNKQQTSLPINEELDGQLTECEKKTIGKQSKLIQTSTSQEALLDVPTTFTKEVSEHISEPTFQYSSCYSMMESLKNEINTLKIKYVELEKKVIATTDKMKNLMEEKEYFKSPYIQIKNVGAVSYNHISENGQNKVKEEILSTLKEECTEF